MGPKSPQYADDILNWHMANGLPRSTASVLVHLTFCEPARQTANEIQQTLRFSAGSISSSLTILRRVGLICRTKDSGDKKYYYELDHDGWMRATLQRFAALDTIVDLTDKAVKSAPDNQRIASMHRVYELFSNEFKTIEKRITDDID
jgi:DNA-binding transcriptional regulator GbsR (MarR family)